MKLTVLESEWRKSWILSLQLSRGQSWSSYRNRSNILSPPFTLVIVHIIWSQGWSHDMMRSRKCSWIGKMIFKVFWGHWLMHSRIWHDYTDLAHAFFHLFVHHILCTAHCGVDKTYFWNHVRLWSLSKISTFLFFFFEKSSHKQSIVRLI